MVNLKAIQVYVFCKGASQDRFLGVVKKSKMVFVKRKKQGQSQQVDYLEKNILTHSKWHIQSGWLINIFCVAGDGAGGCHFEHCLRHVLQLFANGNISGEIN